MVIGRGYVMFAKQEIEQSIPARFAAQVQRAPEAIAVSAPDGTLTYRELEDQANRFAATLPLALPPQPIPIQIGQSAQLPAAILGILKAGHFYVPDVGQSSDCAGLQPRSASATAPAPNIRNRSHRSVLALNAPRHSARGYWRDCAGLQPRSASIITPDSLAYVYYTSGSTGEPKGVMDSHRNVLHNIYRYTNAFRIGPSDRLTLLQSVTFSGAVSSMFCALLNGATCYPLSPQGETPAALARWVNSNQLTMWHSVPSLFRHLCASGARFPSIRVVRLEGDQAAPGDLALFQRYFSRDAVLANSLGTTETGIARRFLFSARAPVPDAIVPVGYPVEDMELELLDVDEEGVGEIAFKSHYLALGYWNRPDLTARAFTALPDGRRLYRTGDLGRLRTTDCLEHLGRKDHAIKIAGNRVEVLAVEAALCRIPGIQQAAVAARPNRQGDLRLGAWLVPSVPGSVPAVDTLRRALAAAELPLHAVPSAFSFVDRLPLNANGKVDRAQLPDRGRARPHLEAPYAPPETAAEHAMAAAWAELLELDEVGIDDDFFSLGGSSLDAARTGLAMDALVATPTIRQLARPRPRVQVVTVRAGRGNQEAPLFCVPPHSGLLVGYHNLARHLAPGRPLLCFAPPEIGEAFQPYTVRDLAVQYLAALRAAQPAGPYNLSGYCFGGWVAYEMACQLEEAGETVDLLTLVECYFEGWIASQPLARRASARLRHGAQRTLLHLQGGPSHWAALRQRVFEMRSEAALQEDFERTVAAGLPLPEHLRDPRYPNRLAGETFAPGPYSGRVLLFESTHPRAREYPAPQMGWGGLLRGEVELCRLAGEFSSLLSEPVVAQLAGRIDLSLGSVAPRYAGKES